MVPIQDARAIAAVAEVERNTSEELLRRLDEAVACAETPAARGRALCEKANYLQLACAPAAQAAACAEEALALMDGQAETLRNLETIAYSAGLLVHLLKDSDRLRAERLARRAMSAIRRVVDDPASEETAVYHLCRLASYVHADLEQ